MPLAGGCAARKSAEATTCSGSFHGSLAARKLLAFCQEGFDNSVLTGPGMSTLAMMPSSHTSSAIAWGQRVQGRFGRAIDAQVRMADLAHARADIDDVPAALSLHNGQYRAATADDTHDVNLPRLLPLFIRRV